MFKIFSQNIYEYIFIYFVCLLKQVYIDCNYIFCLLLSTCGIYTICIIMIYHASKSFPRTFVDLLGWLYGLAPGIVPFLPCESKKFWEKIYH